MVAIWLTFACIISVPASAQVSRTDPSLTVVLRFDKPFSETSLRAMKREADAILAPAVSVQWRLLSDLSGSEALGEVVVSHFNGTCEIAGAPLRVVTTRLADSVGSTGQLLPFPNIDCDAVRTLLMRNRSSESTPRLEYLLGVGLARVLAHEIYHELLNTPDHGRIGVAKASFAASDLFTGVLRFQSAEIQKINHAVSAREIAEIPAR